MNLFNLTNILKDVTCGNMPSFDAKLPYITSTIVTIIQIGIPIILIIFGMMDLGKAVMAQKEDEIKKGQQIFIKRLIAAVIVFFIVVVVKLVIGLVATSDEGESVNSCISCFIENKCDK